MKGAGLITGLRLNLTAGKEKWFIIQENYIINNITCGFKDSGYGKIKEMFGKAG